MLKKEIKFCKFAWGLVFYMLSFNVSDTLGKQIAGNRNLFNKKITTIVFFIRFTFIFVYFYLAIVDEANVNNVYIKWIFNDWVALLNTFLFGLTNGFLTNAYFVLGPEMVKDELKETTGFILVLGLLSGIFIGSMGALLFSMVV